MSVKLKANGATVRSLNEAKLREVHEKGGKQGHKARMELIRRGLMDAQDGSEFKLEAGNE